MKYLDPSFTEAVGTAEFREGHARIFGDKPRETGRRRFVYTSGGMPIPGGPVEVSADFTPGAESTVPPATDRYLEGERAADGTDISSRRKRDEYMRREGVTHANDYRESFRWAAERRAEFFRGNTGQTNEITETVGRNAYRIATQRKKR